MNKVNREAIVHLLESEDSVALSLYLPTHRHPTSAHINEDKIRFKNLIKSGKESLKSVGVDDGVILQVVSELENGVFTADDFWQHTTEGLAVFCTAAGVYYFHLPIECGEYVAAGDKYDIAPLLIAASIDKPYYLLALAAHKPAFFCGDMYGLEKVAIDLPESPEKALNIDELHSNSRTFRDRGSEAGHPGAKSHGQGDSRQAGQEELLKFFRIIDEKILTSKEVDRSRPILLAGTEDDVSGYRESSHMKQLLSSTLKGNYTEATTHDIHARSWPLIVEELCEPERAKDIEKIRSLLGTGKASVDIESVVNAAREGRVDTLLLGMLTKTRDSVSDTKGAVMKMVFFDRHRADKINSSVRSVFDQGGRAVGILKDAMPANAVEAAIFRY